MENHSKKILITGSRGFTGMYLRQILESRGHEVIGLINEGQPDNTERVVDLRNELRLRAVVDEISPCFVVHLAAMAFVGTNDWRSMYETNVTGSLNLLDSISRLVERPRRVILASSAQVYGDPGMGVPDETTLPSPINQYGASKLAMEAISYAYAQKLECIICRPFNYTGPGQASNFLVPKIVHHFVRRAKKVELGNLFIERDFLDVRIVAKVYADLLDQPELNDKVVNICSGRSVALSTIIDKLEHMTGHQMKVVVNSRYVRSNEIKKLVGCPSRLRRTLGWSPAFNLEETLEAMLSSSEIANKV